MSIDVVFGLVGDIRFNARALKQLRALSELGYRTLALGVAEEALSYKLTAATEVRLLKKPEGRGPSFFWKIHQMMKKVVEAEPAQVYHASDLYTLTAMRRIARKRGAKLVYDARERYPYVASTVGRPWVSWVWEMIERRGLRRADAVFTVSESIASHISATYNVDLPIVLYNVPSRQSVDRNNTLRDLLDIAPGQAVLLHQGKIQKDRGCTLLVHAMQDVDNADLVFLGDGPLRSQLEEAVRQKGLDGKVHFLDPVAPEVLLKYTASADIGVTLLEDTCMNHRYALPNKLFEYLMADTPVLASDLPEIEHVITTYDVGRVVYPEDPKAIARVINEMIAAPDHLQKWAANTTKVFETFNWETASEEFKRVYRPLVNG